MRLLTVSLLLAAFVSAQDFGFFYGTPNDVAGDSNVLVGVNSVALSNRVAEVAIQANAAALAKLATHTNRMDNPHAVTAEQVGAPSVAELYTLMSTGRIERVWEGTNAWYTFASNTVTRKDVAYTWRIDCNIGGVYTYITNHAVELPYPLIHDESYSVDGWTLYIGGGDQALFSLFEEVISDYEDFSTTTGGVFDTSQNLTGYATLYRASQTNTTVYYIQTNLVPPETWSYTDQTNWMADGNAGQIWVSDLSASMANAILNGHLNATEPHAGKYALQTGGTMTNVTLAGNVTIGGVTRTSWPSGSTQDVYTPITNLPVVANGATNVVTITADKRIYLITATNTFNAMTNVFNGVTIGGSNVAWELWVDFTNPNGTNMTWCPCMTFDLGVPDISVTGIYKFACSTIDGIKANVRQVYPTVWPWTWTIFGSKNNNLGASPSLFIEASNTDSTNNYNIATQPADVYNYVRCRYWYYTYDATAATNPTIWLAGYSYEQQPPTLTVIATNKAIRANGGQLDWVLPPATANGRVPWLWLYHRKPYFQGRWSATGMQQRRANELEINAWNSGWRP